MKAFEDLQTIKSRIDEHTRKRDMMLGQLESVEKQITNLVGSANPDKYLRRLYRLKAEAEVEAEKLVKKIKRILCE